MTNDYESKETPFMCELRVISLGEDKKILEERIGALVFKKTEDNSMVAGFVMVNGNYYPEDHHFSVKMKRDEDITVSLEGEEITVPSFVSEEIDNGSQEDFDRTESIFREEIGGDFKYIVTNTELNKRIRGTEKGK